MPRNSGSETLESAELPAALPLAGGSDDAAPIPSGGIQGPGFGVSVTQAFLAELRLCLGMSWGGPWG